ncbi:MAG: hypothetical protein H8E13_08145 [Actinobacteria bacterium]|nr:hypothetical protein [Actinomycetota bacterium]
MNIFNRIMMILLLLFIIISSIVIVVNIFTNLFQWSNIFNRILVFRESINIYIVALIFLAIIIISILVLFFEFYRRKIKTTNITAVKDGKAMITIRSASQQIEEDLKDIQHISNLKANVLPKSDGALINIFAKLQKGINVSKKMQEVIREANKSATENLGIKVIKTNFTATGFVPKADLVTVDELEDEEEEKSKSIAKEPKEIKTTEDDYS